MYRSITLRTSIPPGIQREREVRRILGDIQSYGFSSNGFNTIVVFKEESDMREIVAANPGMTAIMGADSYTKNNFPGVFIAGVKESSHADTQVSRHSATRK